MLAKSSICPGIITIIWSLITSNTNAINEKEDEEEVEIPSDENQDNSGHNMMNGNGQADARSGNNGMNTSTSSIGGTTKKGSKNASKYQNPYDNSKGTN